MKNQKVTAFSHKRGKKLGIVSNMGHIGVMDNSYELVVNPFNVELDSATAAVISNDTVETKVLSFANTNSVHFNFRTPSNLDNAGLIKITIVALPYASTAWGGGTAKLQGAVVVPTTGEDGLYYVCTTAGTTHAITEPTWPDEVGETVTDNDIVWTAVDGAEVAFDISAKIFADGEAVKQTGLTKTAPVIYTYPATAADGGIATVQSVYIKTSDLGLIYNENYSIEIIRKAVTYSAGHVPLGVNVGVASFTFEFPVK